MNGDTLSFTPRLRLLMHPHFFFPCFPPLVLLFGHCGYIPASHCEAPFSDVVVS